MPLLPLLVSSTPRKLIKLLSQSGNLRVLTTIEMIKASKPTTDHTQLLKLTADHHTDPMPPLTNPNPRATLNHHQTANQVKKMFKQVPKVSSIHSRRDSSVEPHMKEQSQNTMMVVIATIFSWDQLCPNMLLRVRKKIPINQLVFSPLTKSKLKH